MTDKPTENQAVSGGAALLPCPFCEAVPQSDIPAHAGRHIVTHRNGCWLGKRMKANGTWQELYADLESKDWNTRVNPDSHAALVEALEAFMEPMRRYTKHTTWLKGDEDLLIEAYNKARAALAGQGGEKE